VGSFKYQKMSVSIVDALTYNVFNLYLSIRCGTYKSPLHTTKRSTWVRFVADSNLNLII